MSFIATADADTPLADTLANNGFFPDIDLQELQDAMRLDGTVTMPRLKHATVEAVTNVNGELADWRRAQQALGFERLADVPADRIDDESVLVARYLRAVYCLAKANLTERYRDFDATHDGHKRATELESPIDDLRRDARWAISDILGRRRNTVELI
jgi:hypothetical protein